MWQFQKTSAIESLVMPDARFAKEKAASAKGAVAPITTPRRNDDWKDVSLMKHPLKSEGLQDKLQDQFLIGRCWQKLGRDSQEKPVESSLSAWKKSQRLLFGRRLGADSSRVFYIEQWVGGCLDPVTFDGLWIPDFRLNRILSTPVKRPTSSCRQVSRKLFCWETRMVWGPSTNHQRYRR